MILEHLMNRGKVYVHPLFSDFTCEILLLYTIMSSFGTRNKVEYVKIKFGIKFVLNISPYLIPSFKWNKLVQKL